MARERRIDPYRLRLEAEDGMHVDAVLYATEGACLPSSA